LVVDEAAPRNADNPAWVSRPRETEGEEKAVSSLAILAIIVVHGTGCESAVDS